MVHHARLALVLSIATFSLATFSPATVTPVLAGAPTITGYEIVADPALQAAIAPMRTAFLANVGKPFTRDVQLDDVKKLQGLGTVALVKTGTKAYKDGEKLCYKVEANPVVKAIELEGLTQLPADEVLREFKTQPGQVLDYTRLFEDLNRIPEMYLQKKGILYTDVTDVKDVKVEDGRVTVKVREFAMGDLVVRGVSGAEADLVRRTFHVKRGAPVQRSQLMTSLCDIYQLSTVEDVDFTPRFDKDAARVDIVLDVIPAGEKAEKKEKGRYPRDAQMADPKAPSEL